MIRCFDGRLSNPWICIMNDGRKFSVVVLHSSGMRQVEARNISLGQAQAVQVAMSAVHLRSRVLIEPPPQLFDGHQTTRSGE